MDGFLPAVRSWFAAACGAPTPAQAQGWPAIRAGGHVLIAAPTGTGKTLAAFLVAIDQLLRADPGERCVVLYVSPLKALSNDVQKNLLRPLEAIAATDPFLPRIRVDVRTGDTTATDRAKMLRRPPHILVTTPESLAVLLTSAGGRNLLGGIRTVIVDEIHAVAGTKRGAHLALSLERLHALCGGFQRIGLSATARPLSEVGSFLAGAGRPCTIIDCTAPRPSDLGIEIPTSPLTAVCSHETWGEVHARLGELIAQHRTTLVFVNNRKMAERLALRLAEGWERARSAAAPDTPAAPAPIACHHGSMSKERRLDAEQRLKRGELRCLVATATLELGIDIGDVDLVVQIGSPHALHTFLQRLGRAGHGPARTPKARLFALTTDELAEAAALLMGLAEGDLDRMPQVPRPWDVLAQQVVAAAAETTWNEDDLHRVLTRAWPYRDTDRAAFGRVVAMHSQGRRALLHRDEITGTVRGTRRARLTALLNAGAIPDTALFQVREDASDLLIGTLDEDFSLESSPGDIFQLGNTAWRIVRVDGRAGVVRVADARGAPPTIPFWLGEAPGRTRELSAAVGRLRRLADGPDWLMQRCRLTPQAAAALWEYLASSRASLGELPTDRRIVAERFFDETGGQHVVIHAPVGTRILRAWGLALRKRFCAGFGFELEAAANDEALILSLAPTTSFPLDEVFGFLSPATLRKTLITACLTGGRFQTQWRQTAQIALLIERAAAGGKVPPHLQRIRANDALIEAFPQANACPDNLPPDRIEIPEDHPVVAQTIDDLLCAQMDSDGLAAVLDGIRAGTIEVHAVDTAEASPLAQSILAARPYAFLDDTPFEERRTRAVAPSTGQRTPDHPGDLDPAAVAEVRAQIWPEPRSADELHQVLQWCGWLTAAELDAEPRWAAWRDDLVAAGRVVRGADGWTAATTQPPAAEDALAGRLEITGPVPFTDLPVDAVAALALEARGILMRVTVAGRGHWCRKHIVQRIQRVMIERRRGVWQEPASIDEFLRFLSRWQGVTGERRQGRDGLVASLRQLAALELPAAAWTGLVLPARVADLKPEWLDDLTLSGEFAWGRLWTTGADDGPGTAGEVIRTTPITIVPRADLAAWLAISGPAATSGLSSYGRAVLDTLAGGGALFTADLQARTRLFGEHLERGLGECIAAGLIAADSFAALRWLLLPGDRRAKARPPAGRWCVLRQATASADDPAQRPPADEDAAALVARTLLERTGIAVRRLYDRERITVSWRDVHRALRRMELRGDCLGGRFIAGLGGEQFALPAAAERLRRIRSEPPGAGAACSAADPLNYTGILGDGPRVRAVAHERIQVA